LVGYDMQRDAWYGVAWVLCSVDAHYIIQYSIVGLRIPRGGEERPVLLPRDMYIYLTDGWTDRGRELERVKETEGAGASRAEL
jgi:hypothetical protein